MATKSTSAVVLFSGGLDSTTLLAERLDARRDVLALSFNYGQRHRRELEAAREVIQHYVRMKKHNISWRIVDLSPLNILVAGSGSSQIDSNTLVPHGHYADESMKTTVVPNRNMVMLSLATAHAIAHEASEVCYAAHAGDHAIYPDCRPQFVKAMAAAIALCHYPTSTPLVYTPFINLSKADTVVWGSKIGAPYALTYSCYEGRSTHCGKCGTCVERKEAFELAGVPDPTIYAPTA